MTKQATNKPWLSNSPSVLQHPEMYLHELQETVYVLTGVHLSKASLCTFLNQIDFMCSRQKCKLWLKQRNEALRDQFSIDVSLYKPDIWRYGYSIRCKPPRSLKLLVRGERVSVIEAMSSGGM